jgi:hypothetical protein
MTHGKNKKTPTLAGGKQPPVGNTVDVALIL